MELQQVQSAATAATSATSTRTSALTSDFKDFVALLSAQAKYQDPLEPISSTDYVAQLAQFSSVEQQVLTNELMSLQIEYSVATAVASLSGWVGMEARAAAPVMFDGAPVTVYPNIPDGVDQAQLVITDSDGTEVERIELDVGGEDESYVWDGYDSATGTDFAHGTYHFQVEGFSQGESTGLATAQAYGRVTEAQLQGGEILLVLDGGSSITTADITGIRDPDLAY